MAEPEDVRIDNAEDREWERLRDTVETAMWDIDNECSKCGRRVYGEDAEPHAANCGFVIDELLSRDEPRFRFVEE